MTDLDTSLPVIIVTARTPLEEIDYARLPAGALIFREGPLESESHYWFGRDVAAWFLAPRVATVASAARTLYRGDYSIGQVLSDVPRLEQLPHDLDAPGVPAPQVTDWNDILLSHPVTAKLITAPHPPSVPVIMVAVALALGFSRVILLDGAGRTATRESSPVVDEPVQRALRPGSRQAESYELSQLRSLVAAFPDAVVLDAATTEPYERFLPPLTGAAPKRLVPSVKTDGLRTGQRLYVERTVGSSVRRCAYVTYFDEDGYFWGAVAMARSLAQVSDYPLIALVPTAYAVPQVPFLPPNLVIVPAPRIRNVQFSGDDHQNRFQFTYSKLAAFSLTFLDRAVYLDADTVVLRDIDELFDGEGFAAAPDFGLELHRKDFNSGVFAFDPSAEQFRRLMELNGQIDSSDGGDQGYLNAIFDKVTWLDHSFNTLRRMFEANPGLVSLGETRVLHFVGPKPWQLDTTRVPDDLLQLWLDKLGADYLPAFTLWRAGRTRVEIERAAAKAAAAEVAAAKAAAAESAAPAKTKGTAADAQSLLAQGDLDAAEAIVRGNLKTNPESLRNRMVLAKVHLRRGRVGDAVRVYGGMGRAVARRSTERLHS